MPSPHAPGAAGHHVLPFGQFFGREDVRRRGPGVEMSLLHADPHHIVGRHSHESAHFVLILDGLYVSSAEGAPPVSPRPLLIFNPAGTTHADRFEARGERIAGRSFTMSVNDEVLRESRWRDVRPGRAYVLDDPSLMVLASRLSRACTVDGGDASLTQYSLAIELVSRAARRDDAPRPGAPAWLLRARKYLDDSLGRSVSIAEVAALVDVHPVHLARVFRQQLGVTPAEYLRRRRIEQARVLLRHTSRTLSDIALTCGFGDQCHFTNAFRNAQQETPAAFRKRHRA